MRVCVVGAGMTGLVAAHRLAGQGHVVDVYERWPGLGGMAATLDVGGGHRLERYYHHLFTSDRHIVELFDELGLPDELEWRTSRMAFFAHGRQYPFTTPGDLLRFEPLSPLSRLRMGAVVVALQRFSRDPARFEDVTAREWISSRMGRQVWEEVWGPMLRGKFADRADEVAMVWLWSKWMLRRSVRGQGVREERLGYPRSSWEPLLERLAASVAAAGGRVLVDRPVARLGRGADGIGFEVVPGLPGAFRSGLHPGDFPVDEATDAVERYDAVLSTVTTDLFLALCDERLRAELGPAYTNRCTVTEYHGALCLLLELDRSFTPFYWTNVSDARLPFIGLIEHTNFVPAERYDGRRFLYVANYLHNDDALMAMTTDELIAAYGEGMRLVNPDWTPSWIRDAWSFREPHGQPIVTIGYRDRLPAMRTPVPGLCVATIAHVYPEDRGTNYAVRLGDQAAAALVGHASATPRAPEAGARLGALG